MNNKTVKYGVATLFILLLLPKGKASKKYDDLKEIGPVTFATPTGSEGSANESFLGANMVRGIRNNNPGNIIRSSNNWLGKIPHSLSNDTKFEQFQTLAHGTRAMLKLLQNYINTMGRNTPKKIIQYWSVSDPNYTAFLVKETGFGENQVLTADKATLKKLAKAITKFENGIDFLTDSRFETAYSML